MTDVQHTLIYQIRRLVRIIENNNSHFTYALLTADEHLSARPEHYSPGSFEEMELLLQYSYPAWWQHEGALELLQSAKSIAAKDSEDEIEDLMEGSRFRDDAESNRESEELLDDLSLNRLWEYLGDAVDDAISLNEPRPSEVRRLEAREIWRQDEEEERELMGDDTDDDYDGESD